jgi:glycosyltransferase involved in cell wall biosynthesis
MKKNKNITFLGWRDPWHPKGGGAETYITKVAEHLAKEGYTVKFLTSMYRGASKQETKNGVHYHRLGNKITIYILLPILFLLKYKSQTDLLIENYNSWPFGVPLLHRPNLTVIHHLGNEEWKFVFGTFLGSILKFLSELYLKILYKNKNIVTVSESTREELEEKGITSPNLEIIHNGINDNFFKIKLKPKPQKAINILHLGRLVHHKRIHLGLELIAYAVHDKGFTNITYNIAGKGEELENLEQKTNDLNIDNYVKFHGFVSEEEKHNLLQKSHLLLYLSPREGWGITVIEAASLGVPTLCFNVPGLRDSVKPETGYLVNTKEELFNKFKNILQDIKQNTDSYIDKQKKAIKWATNFSWPNLLEKWEQKIRELIV